jgi:hypothetical protein
MKVVRKMTFGSKSQKTCNYATIASEENGWDSLSQPVAKIRKILYSS